MTSSNENGTLQTEIWRLLQGEVLIDLRFLPDDVIGVRGRIFIDAGREAVWNSLTDYDNLSRTLPKVLASRVAARNGNEIILDQTGRTGIFFFEKTVNFRLKVTEKDPQRIEFEQESGDFRVYRGAWVLEPAPTGNGTLLTYEAELKPDFFAPPILVSFVQRQDLPGILRAHKHRAETPVRDPSRKQ